jgi:hypothetical protein
MAANPGRFIEFGVKNTNSETTSPLSNLLANKKFDYNITKYPLDLGAAGQGRSHYIVFHILEQRKSQYKTDSVNSSDAGENSFNSEKNNARLREQAGASAIELAALGVGATVPFLSNGYSTLASSFAGNPFVDILTETGGKVINQFGTVIQDANRLGFLRTVTKTSETIALYMPDTLNFIQPQGYADLEMGNS